MPYLCICLLRVVFFGAGCGRKGEKVIAFAAFKRLAVSRKEAITGLWADFFLGNAEKAWALIVKAWVFKIRQKSLRAWAAGRS